MGRCARWGCVNLCDPDSGLTVAGKAVECSGSLGTALLKIDLHCCFILIMFGTMSVSSY